MSDRYKVKLPVCYLDMDGVVCNFHWGACMAHGRDPEATMRNWPKGEYSMETAFGMTSEEFWGKCRDYSFWRNMPLLPGAVRLYDKLTTKFEVVFVSMVTGGGECPAAKVDWLQYYFGRDVRYCMLHCSKGYMNPSQALLIDDYEKNIDQFGGTGLLYPAVWNSKHELAGRLTPAAVVDLVCQRAMTAVDGSEIK